MKTHLKIPSKYPVCKATICSTNGKRYRYGFNGMEKDNETYGEGNAYDFGARIYDSRLGRFMSRDPLFNYSINVSSTPYGFAQNTPIMAIDKDGKFIWVAIAGVGGFIAGVTVGVIKGEPWQKVLIRGVTTGAACAIVALVPAALLSVGVSGAAAVQAGIIASAFTGMAEAGVRYGLNSLFGLDKEFDEENFSVDMILSIPSHLLGESLDIIGKVGFSKLTSELIEKELPKSTLKQMKSVVKDQIKKQSKAQGKKLTKKQLDEAADKGVLTLIKQGKETTKATIKTVEDGVRLITPNVTSTLIIDGVVEDEKTENEEKSEKKDK